ncbi:MAG: two-component sensor histidine kinase [Myxococcales bacterium]|nr:two-component sensor histidine kinase [Myxococcales bacterium]
MTPLPGVSRSRPPPPGGEGDLALRLTRLVALRLFVLTLFLAFVTLIYLRGQTGGFSSLVMFATVAFAYGVSAVYAAIVRKGKLLRQVAFAQLITDQLTWSAIAYVTGGISSGGVSLYGLSCIAGAIALGARGAGVALGAAAVCYLGLGAGVIHEVLPLPPDQSAELYATTWAAAAYPMLVNFFGLALVASMSGYLAERLRSAGGDLAKAEARAEEAERLAALGRLATGLAHEIRNPLGGIAGSIELLATSPSLTDEDRRLCEIVQIEADRLNALVSDMLDLSRPRPPLIDEVDAVALARDVVLLASRSGRGRDLNVTFKGPDSLLVRADAAQLRQLLWNLVRNAVQASSAGDEVEVQVARAAGGRATLSVSDRGPGIEPDAMGRIFDAFFTTRSHGTGVGLAVVKRIVDAHGFAIEVASVGGATFTVTVPKGSVVPARPSQIDPREASESAPVETVPAPEAPETH